MYLEQNQIDNLFRSLSDICSPGSQFAFTFMAAQKNGAIDFKHTSALLKIWLALKKERFRWGIQQQNMSSFLESKNFLLKQIVSHNDLRSKYLGAYPVNLPLAEGECICFAEAKN